ncbi:hypothetical protein G3O08_16010 [Cryomorpha ignava]|uniref:Uncharacterized protein n=1 Tax=Cryomorpha ignava TaxID=101383 RepID=A0A7K3WU44_9FLAO|nr:hypothetical protein [Cryomorpha ignava]NEN25006.1 hypothetical protein [Cryomorpha ignava]
MTENQEKRVRAKIAKIKKALAADKKHWGGYYHDGGGLRYVQPELYIKLEDYTGALRYFNWFDKHFSDDVGSPLFWFQYSLTLYKTKRVERAKTQIIQAHFLNEYLIDYFLDPKSIEHIRSSNNWPIEVLIKYFGYKKESFPEFSEWLAEYSKSKAFIDLKNEIKEIDLKLDTEEKRSKRAALLSKRSKLIKNGSGSGQQ